MAGGRSPQSTPHRLRLRGAMLPTQRLRPLAKLNSPPTFLESSLSEKRESASSARGRQISRIAHHGVTRV